MWKKMTDNNENVEPVAIKQEREELGSLPEQLVGFCRLFARNEIMRRTIFIHEAELDSPPPPIHKSTDPSKGEGLWKLCEADDI